MKDDPNQPDLFETEPEPEAPRVCNQCGRGDEGCECCVPEETS